MFTVPGNSNPLDDLVAHTGSALVQGQLKAKAQQKKMTSIQQALGEVDENSSPLDWLRAIKSIEGLEPDEEKNIMGFYEKLAGAKQKSGEDAKKASQEQADKLVVDKLNKGEEITEDEFGAASVPTKKFIINAQKQPKAPGGVSAQPVPEDVAGKIKQVIDQNKSASSDELALLMDEAGIPRAYSNSYIENRRRQDEKGNAREDILEAEQAKNDIAYQKEIPKMVKDLQHRKDINKQFRVNNAKGVSGKPYEKFLERSGLINLTSEGRRVLGSLQKEYTRGFKQILGSQMSAQEFFTLLNAVPNPDFSQEANEAILNNYDIWADIEQFEIDTANQLIKENNGKPPRNLELEVANRMTEFAQKYAPQVRENIRKARAGLESDVPKGKILMFDPEGEILHVDPSDVEEYKSLGATEA